MTATEKKGSLVDTLRAYIFGTCSFCAFVLIAYYVLLMTQLYPKIREHETEHYKANKGNYEGLIDYYMFWPSLVCCLCLFLLNYTIRVCLGPIIEPLCKDQENPKALAERKKKVLYYSFSVLYNIIFTIWGFYVIYDTPVWPKEFGGTGGTCKDYNFPHSANALFDDKITSNLFNEKIPGASFFSITNMGYALYKIVGLLLLEKKSNDFAEMLLHHLCTLTLVAGMTFSNYERFGVVIAFVHLLADIPLAITKALSHTHFKITSIISYVFTLAIWMYTRNYLVVKLWLCSTSLTIPEPFKEFQIIYNIKIGFLGVLCFMHYFWIILMLKIMIVEVMIQGKTEDTQAKLQVNESTEVNANKKKHLE